MTNEIVNTEVSQYQVALIAALDARIQNEVALAQVKTNSKTAEKFEKLRKRLIANADAFEALNVNSDFVKRCAIYVCDKIVATCEALKNNTRITDAHIVAILKNAQALQDSDIEFDFNLLRSMCSKNCDHAHAKKLKYRNAAYDAATASTQASYAKTTLVEFKVCREDFTQKLDAKNVSRNKVVFDYESDTLTKLFTLI